MGRKDPAELKDLIMSMMRAYGHEDKLLEMSISKEWEQLFGEYIARKTDYLEFSKGHLKVKMESSVIREELAKNKTSIMESLNRNLKKRIIKTIDIF